MEDKNIHFNLWLTKTQSLNLELADLINYIGHTSTCPHYIWKKLDGQLSFDKAENLFALWKNEKPDDLNPLVKLLKNIDNE